MNLCIWQLIICIVRFCLYFTMVFIIDFLPKDLSFISNCWTSILASNWPLNNRDYVLGGFRKTDSFYKIYKTVTFEKIDFDEFLILYHSKICCVYLWLLLSIFPSLSIIWSTYVCILVLWLFRMTPEYWIFLMNSTKWSNTIPLLI